MKSDGRGAAAERTPAEFVRNHRRAFLVLLAAAAGMVYLSSTAGTSSRSPSGSICTAAPRIPGVTSVLEATPPSFSAAEVARIAAELFGIEGTAIDLGSERDQTFLVEGPSGQGIVKISNLGERPATLDFEAEAILHIARVDPELPVALPRVVSAGEGAAAYRTTVEGADGIHFVRCFGRMEGRRGGPDLSDAAVRGFGAVHARLVLALRGFFHPGQGNRGDEEDCNQPCDHREFKDRSVGRIHSIKQNSQHGAHES